MYTAADSHMILTASQKLLCDWTKQAVEISFTPH